MNIQSNYEEHVAIAKELKMGESFYEVREPHKEAFEEIYSQAKEEKVTMSNAKEFLNSLTNEELGTLQDYALLVDEINVDSLNDEGAYNLLLHHYEKYDFNKDGLVSNGISQGGSLIPENMPTKEKKALVESLNEMDEKDSFLALMMINLPKFVVAEDGTVTTKFNNDPMDYNAIMDRIHRILNPQPGEHRSASLLDTISRFQEIFKSNFEESDTKREQYQAQQQNDSNIVKAKINT